MSSVNTLAKATEMMFQKDPVSGSAETLAPLADPNKPRLTFESLLFMPRRGLERIPRRLAENGSVLLDGCSWSHTGYSSLLPSSMHLALTMTSPAYIPLAFVIS